MKRKFRKLHNPANSWLFTVEYLIYIKSEKLINKHIYFYFIINLKLKIMQTLFNILFIIFISIILIVFTYTLFVHFFPIIIEEIFSSLKSKRKQRIKKMQNENIIMATNDSNESIY